MIHERDIESPNGNIVMRVEIVYDAHTTEYGSLDGGRLEYRIPGQLDLQEVNVLAVTGYDMDGEAVYEYDHRQMTKERLDHLDEIAWGIVENDICDGGLIYEDLWQEV